MEELSFDELVDKLEVLLGINSENIDAEALRSNKIFGEVQRLHGHAARKLKTLLVQQKQVQMHRWKRYAGKWTSQQYKDEPLGEAVLKTDIDRYMAIDPVMVEINAIVDEQDRIMKLLEDAKAQYKQRTWDIKNAIEFRRMISGQ